MGKPRQGRTAGTSRGWTVAISAVLFITIGLVGAFLASAFAGMGGGTDAGGVGEFGDGDARTLPAGTLVRIEVLNGAGAPGLARLATNRLRAEGFDVVFFGNAPRFDHVRSVVLDRTGDATGAWAVAAVLGIDSVATAPDPGLLLDVTVVLGTDWPPPPGPALHRLRRSPDPAAASP